MTGENTEENGMKEKEAREIGARNALTAIDSFGEFGDYPRWEDAYFAYQENFSDTVEARGGTKNSILVAAEEYDLQWEKAGFNPSRAYDIYSPGGEE